MNIKKSPCYKCEFRTIGGSFGISSNKRRESNVLDAR